MALDCSAVLVGHLKADTDIAAVVGTAVHNKRLPDGVGPPAIIVDMVGDATDPDYKEILIKKFTVTCIGNGTTANQERTLQGLVTDYMLDVGAGAAVNGGIIMVAYQDDSDTSEVESIDEETGWPFITTKWEVHFYAS